MAARRAVHVQQACAVDHLRWMATNTSWSCPEAAPNAEAYDAARKKRMCTHHTPNTKVQELATPMLYPKHIRLQLWLMAERD